MHRDKLTEKLVRIIAVIEADKLPARVRELYVFGSYSRGALEPGDLDLIVVHDRAKPEYEKPLLRKLQEEFEDCEAARRAVRKFKVDMRRAMHKPGEPVQTILTQELDWVVDEGSKIKQSDLVLLWSNEDRKWEEKLARIRPDETAGRAPRRHLISMTRVHDRVSVMERVVEMIDRGELLLTRITVDEIDCKLNTYHEHWLNRWTRCEVMGKKSMETLPYAMWWLQQYRQHSDLPNRTEIWSKSRTHRLEVGRPSLFRMRRIFENFPKVKRQCLIPHFKSRDANELLVFERGPNWKSHGSR